MTAPHPTCLVLSEGREDSLVQAKLAEESGLTEGLTFEDYGGNTKLRDYLKNLKARAEFASGSFYRVLLTRDANGDYNAAWKSLSDAAKVCLGVELSDPGEWIQVPNGPEMAAWVIPGPGGTGMIESLCMSAAEATDPKPFECVNSFVECLEKLHGATPHEKVRFAVWTIAAQKKDARKRLSLERAIDHLPIDWGSKGFDPLRDVLRDAVKAQ